jgi:sulfur carrier protein ThiS
MKIYVFIEKENKHKTIEIKTGAKAIELLKKLNINLTTVLLVRNKEVIIDQTILKNKDKVEILSVISGG